MTTNRTFLCMSTLLLGLIAQGAGVSEATAQSASSGLPQEQRSGSDRNSASVAQVGAGTTSGSTTGSSGPQTPTPGRISLPALPSAQLCEAYKDTPAYQHCLSVTLRQ